MFSCWATWSASCCSDRLRQPQPAEQLMEPRVALERLPPRVHAQRNQLKTAILKCLRQPIEALAGVPEGEVEGSQFEGRHIPFFGQSVQFLEDAERLLAFS